MQTRCFHWKRSGIESKRRIDTSGAMKVAEEGGALRDETGVG